jgi:TatD DNase family protein
MHVDAHNHLDQAAFDEDRARIIERAAAMAVDRMVVAGTDPSGWIRCRELAVHYPGIVWTAGIHPWWTAEMSPTDFARGLASLRTIIGEPTPPVGIGELGLDLRFRPRTTLDWQIQCVQEQLDIAVAADLPLVLHIVDAHGPAIELLEQAELPRRGGMVHAFGASAEMAERYLALGFHLSFAGTLLSANAKKKLRALSVVPDERLLIETDAPDLSPPQWEKRNEPANLPLLAAFIGERRGATADEILALTAQNAVALFGPSRGAEVWKNWPPKRN